MGWLIAAMILFLFGCIPIGVGIRFDADGLVVRLIAGWVRYTVFPFPPKKKDTKQISPNKSQDVPSQKAGSNSKTGRSDGSKGGRLRDFLPLVQIGLRFLNDFRQKLCINHLQFKLILAGDDPCDLGINYGRVWAAVGNILPKLERVLTIKKRNIEVECDFEAVESCVIANLDITISIGRLLNMAVAYGYLVLKELLYLKKKRKGGAVV